MDNKQLHLIVLIITVLTLVSCVVMLQKTLTLLHGIDGRTSAIYKDVHSNEMSIPERIDSLNLNMLNGLRGDQYKKGQESICYTLQSASLDEWHNAFNYAQPSEIENNRIYQPLRRVLRKCDNINI